MNVNAKINSSPERNPVNETTKMAHQTTLLNPRFYTTDFDELDKAIDFSYEDFIKCEGWLNSKNKGKLRLEGKDYIVNDGDILNFRFNT